MLSSRKGNLLCFQWEVERFQRSHREKMEAMTPMMNTRPSPSQNYCHQQQQQHPNKRVGMPRRSARELLTEIDVKRQNAFLVEKMAHIYHAGGFQRRSLNEFQDVKAALEFGKANVSVSRAAHEGRFTARRKQQERIRWENAKIISQLASPKRSDINFRKFETDFVKSRAHHRLAQNNRTVGHTSVFVTPKFRTPPSHGADAQCSPASLPEGHSRGCTLLAKPSSPESARHAVRLEHRGGARRSKVPRRPHSAGKSMSGEISKNIRSDATPQTGFGVHGHSGYGSGAVAQLLRRPQTAGAGKRRAMPTRPHTALGLRRRSDHHNLFDARAADPGWSNGTTNSQGFADRPPSASEKTAWGCLSDTEEGGWSMKEAMSARTNQDRADRGDGPSCGETDARRNERMEEPQSIVVKAISNGLKRRLGEGGLCLGQTLLAEANIIVGAAEPKKNKARRKRGSNINLSCSSLDGLIREKSRVQKTLRGFVVQAARAPSNRKISSPRDSPEAGRSMHSPSRIAAACVSVSAVQVLLNEAVTKGNHGMLKIESNSSGWTNPKKDSSVLLHPFRAASPLNDRGDYPELHTLMTHEGQRCLHQILFCKCRVTLGSDVSGGIGVEVLLTNNVGDVGISATISASEKDQRDVANPRGQGQERATLKSRALPVTAAQRSNDRPSAIKTPIVPTGTLNASPAARDPQASETLSVASSNVGPDTKTPIGHASQLCGVSALGKAGQPDLGKDDSGDDSKEGGEAEEDDDDDDVDDDDDESD